MSWLRSGDTGADYPRVNAVAAFKDPPSGPSGAVLMMHGFMHCLSMNAAAWKSDYVVDVGTVMKYGGTNVEWLLKSAIKTGLLTKVKGKVHGVDAYKIIDDPAYIHMRTKAEQDWDAQQRAETADLRIAVPVRLRDGDLCRYCGVITYWTGGQQSSDRRGTLDHTIPADEEGVHPPATVETMVVSCIRCNASIGDTAPENRPPQLQPPPAAPFYGKTTASFLTKNGYPTSPTAQRPDTTSDPAREDRPQRPDIMSDPARPAASDPAPAGTRAAEEPHAGAPPSTALNREISPESGNSQSAGSGRDGSGRETLLPNDVTSTSAGTRRKRSRRGAQRESDTDS